MTSKLTPPPEARRILDSIRKLVRSLRLVSRKSKSRLGLSAAQIFVLQVLNEASHMPLKELARQTMTDLSSVSVVVERLVKKGLVLRQRSKVDARRLDLCISAEGKKVLRKQPDAIQTRLIQAITRFKPSQREALADSLEALIADAGMAHEQASMLFERDTP